MRKTILIVTLFMLWVSAAVAEEAPGTKTGDVFEGSFNPGYWWVDQSGNHVAGEYEYLKNSPAGGLNLEWDPLPHRFVLESSALNKKDYFGEMDYSYRDVVVFNAYTRGVYHNLNHYTFGAEDPSVPLVTFTDKNIGDEYAIENALTRAFIRFKTPDFPFHLFAEVRTIERDGTIQQRFLRAFSGGLDKVSQSRDIDWNTQEVKVGANSHLGFLEAEYSHSEKKFEATRDKILYDTDTAPPATIPHNLVPDLQSSSDTIKVHTTYSGRFVMAGTYTNGDKKNEDSNAKVKYANTGGDLTYMPFASLLMNVKYRHYEIDATNPDSVNQITTTGTSPVTVRDSISSTRDAISGVVRYRATDRLTLRGEYLTDTTDRTRGTWDLPDSTTKNTAKLGATYYIMRKMTLRADYTSTTVDNPAYDTDPDKANNTRASITWAPTTWFNTLLSYNMARDSRDQLGAPLAGGSRDTSRDQGLASFTVLLGGRSSVTLSYTYLKYQVDQTLSLQDGSGKLSRDPGTPYEDIANVGSLSFTTAPSDRLNLVASATRSYTRGNFTLGDTATVTNTSGIAQLTDLKVIDTVYGAGIEIQHSRDVASEVRYQFRKYDDQLDDTQDGTVKTVLATLSLKW